MCKLYSMLKKARTLMGDGFEVWYDVAYDEYHLFCDVGDCVLHAQSGTARIHFEKLPPADAVFVKSRLVPDNPMILSGAIERWLLDGTCPTYDFKKHVPQDILFYSQGERRAAPRLLSRGYWITTETGMMKKCGSGTVFALTQDGMKAVY